MQKEKTKQGYSVEYAYDVSGASTYFRAGTSVVSPVLSDGSATYTPGISERRNNNSTYYHSDLKNTVAQTASNEAVSGTNQYDAFGNLVNYTGDWHGPFSYGGGFGYQADDDSGLMLLGHRYYDSSTGRFYRGIRLVMGVIGMCIVGITQ
jgi:uncharacterized protein RhaS with RHS repeats